MQRPIKFRGQTIDSGEWVYGDLLQDSKNDMFIADRYCIIDDFVQAFAKAVDPETVGEFTGLKDNNGVEIYENMWAKISAYDYGFCDENPPMELLGIYQVFYDESETMFSFKNEAENLSPNQISLFHIEVIDNPELLEVRS